jgi:hypothetical protein
MVKWEAHSVESDDDECVNHVDAAMDARVLRLEHDLRWYNRLVSRDRVGIVVWFVVMLLVRTMVHQLFGKLACWLTLHNDPVISGVSSPSLYLLMSVANCVVELACVTVSAKALRAVWGLN